MGSNISHSILSIIALVALIELIMICGSVPIVMGGIISCLILEHQANRKDKANQTVIDVCLVFLIISASI